MRNSRLSHGRQPTLARSSFRITRRSGHPRNAQERGQQVWCRRQGDRPRPRGVGRILPVLMGCAILVLCAPDSVLAQRQGFILNLGLGVGETKYSLNGSNALSNGGIATDFKIGYAPSDQLLIYYSNDASFFTLKGAEDFLFVSGLTAIGAKYFLEPSSPSFFVDGSLGFSVFRALEAESPMSAGASGIGLSVGGGYEFARHWLVGLDLVFGRPDEGTASFDTRTIRIALNWLLY